MKQHRKLSLFAIAIVVIAVTAFLVWKSSPVSPAPTDALSSENRPEIPEDDMYDMVSEFYQNSLAEKLPVRYYLYRIQDGSLQGYRMETNEWFSLGTLEAFPLTEENFDRRFADDPILNDYAQSPVDYRQWGQLTYHAVNEENEYILIQKGKDIFWLACLENDTVMWFYQLIRYTRTEELLTVYANASPDVLPPEFTLDIFGRTYRMYIPSQNQSSEGTFSYSEDLTTLILRESGSATEYHFADSGSELFFLPSKSPGAESVFPDQLCFTFSSIRKSDGCYGTAEADLDGDGVPETISVGSGHTSGIFTFCITADGIQDYFGSFSVRDANPRPELTERDGALCVKITTGLADPGEEQFYTISIEDSHLILTDPEGNRLESFWAS